MTICFICKTNIVLNQLQQHFNNYHHYGNNLPFKCAELKCSGTFENFTLLYQHLNTQHHSVQLKTLKLNPDQDLKISTINVQQRVRSKLIEIFTNLYETNVSHQHIQHTIDVIKDIVSSGLDVVRSELEIVYKNNVNNRQLISDINLMFKTFINSFEEFESDHKRLQFLESGTYYIPAIDLTIGRRSAASENNKHAEEQFTEVKAYLFPLRDIFKKIFEIPNVYNKVLNYKEKLEKSNSPVISNFVQSKLWKSILKEFPSKVVFPLFLYYDDYETGNALGSHSGANKIGGTYVSIPCFPLEYQSSLGSIFHALLFYTKDRVHLGNNAVFRKLIEELQFLEREGIEINLSKSKHKIYFKLSLILGDNLGLHSLIGFVECFVANYCCRMCKMNKIQRSLATVEDKFYLRSKKSYETDVKLYDSSATGIKSECIFHEIPGFHVTNNLSVDIMHDLIEGSCRSDMIAIINFYITNGVFSLDDLKDRIKNHDFGMVDHDNVLPQINSNNLKNNTIKMSASEMWTFVRHFGLMIGDLIPEDDLPWQLWIILRQILALVCSTSIQKECSITLNNLVKEHNYYGRKILKRKLTATDHHLVHYGRVMDQSGPLIFMWCMRSESVHQNSKATLDSSNSKVNVCKTISKKQQLKLAHMIYFNTLSSEDLKTGPTTIHRVSDLPIQCNKNCKEYLSSNTVINICNWAKKNSSTYKPGMVICVGEFDSIPRFGLIKFIFHQKDSLYFIYQDLITIFNYHYYAYIVLETVDSHSVMKYEDLFHPRPTGLIKKPNKTFIVLRDDL